MTFGGTEASMGADCERVRELAPELALGIADGEERAWALGHLATCAGCRAHVARLSETADELLLLAPAAEPPPGFEGRVTAALEPPRRPVWRRLAVPVAAALATATAAAAVVWFTVADDRDQAAAYRDTLPVAVGEYFDATPLEAPGGKWAGYVYGYQGEASWVMVVVGDDAAATGESVEIVTGDGRRLPLGDLSVDDGVGSAGFVTPVAFDELAEVGVLDDRGREVADSDVRE